MKIKWGKLMVIGVGLFLAFTSSAQPVITQPPTNQVLSVGDTLTLSVTVSGTSLVYQWFKDSRFLVGATNSTLTVANAGVTNSGTYYVAVTNGSGMVISLPVSVMVGNPILAAWGTNRFGQLGNGTTNNAYLPITVATNVVSGGMGISHSMFLTSDGVLWGMGVNGNGNLGNGTSVNTNRPISVASNVLAVAAGYYHSLFVKTNGTLSGMGYNYYGQLGNGASGNWYSTPINLASNVVAMAGGGMHSMFIKTNGTLWVMGRNEYGQLGNGTTTDAYSPVSVTSNVVAVAAGLYHSLFVKMDGTLWAMGYNNSGQLGNGSNNSTNHPTCVASNVVAVAAGVNHSVFVTTDGTLWVMGANNEGQFGNGTYFNTNRPISVASNVLAVAVGWNHSVFTKTDGTIWAMGKNSSGQLGDGTKATAIWPIKISNVSSVANVFPAGEASHTMALGVINYLVEVTLGNLNQGYTGNAINVSTGTAPAGLAVNLTYSTASYSVSANAPTNPGIYTVIGTVSDPNYYGSMTNTLMIGLRPQSFIVGSHGGGNSTNGQQMTLQLTGTPGYPYILQAATNLTPPIDWRPVLTNPADVNGNWSFTVSNLAMPNLFYRAASQ